LIDVFIIDMYMSYGWESTGENVTSATHDVTSERHDVTERYMT